ncbi:hypothetical protein E6C70_00820 [Glaciibacter flavus]|uniref:Uncharacterized protein n=2 Tax=Orlajensenia flava TaxID=2565934 RepID=A0A4S4FYI1_9MICO|nr:hypothetical protein E6C70_00820 [Glaciibacter flavus]
MKTMTTRYLQRRREALEMTARAVHMPGFGLYEHCGQRLFMNSPADMAWDASDQQNRTMPKPTLEHPSDGWFIWVLAVLGLFLAGCLILNAPAWLDTIGFMLALLGLSYFVIQSRRKRRAREE